MTPIYGAGERVNVKTGKSSAPGGRYRIVSVLPVTNGIWRYRVKNEIEQFERVVDEKSLERATEW